jgi:hypothetical protein
MWLGKSSPWVIGQCLLINKVSYPMCNKVKDSTLSPKWSLNRVPVKIRSGFSVSFVLEPRRRKAPALGCCSTGHGPRRLGKGKKQVGHWAVCGEKEQLGVVVGYAGKKRRNRVVLGRLVGRMGEKGNRLDGLCAEEKRRKAREE